MRLLITGSTGFIGRNLISRLSQVHEVYAVARRQPQLPRDLPVSVINMDLARELDVSALPEKMDAIIHTAMARGTFPESARETFGVSVACTQQLLDYCIRSGAKQFILASTGDVYGRRLDPCKETDTPRPESFYGATKYSAELLVQAYSEYLVPTVLRIFHAYGPGQSQKLVAYLAKQIRSHATIQLHQGRRPYLTPTYIDDVCLAFEKALETSYSGVLNVAGDTVISVKAIAELIADRLGTEAAFEDTGKDAGNMIGVNDMLKKVLKMDSLVELNEGLSRTFKNRKEP